MKYLFLLLLVVGVSACSSDGEERPEYMDSYSVEALEIPPKLTQIENRKELDIPRPSEKAMQLLEERDDVEGAVSPVFQGVSLKSEQGVYWLEIDESAEQVWPVLQDFLAHEGIKVYRNEPMLGFMETEWVKEYKAKTDGGFFSDLFSSVSPDVLDKFRLRVERVPGQQRSKVFVSHRGMEISVVTDEETRWTQRDSEPMLEQELLKRLALFVGLNNKQADEIFADYQPYQARVRVIDADASQYEIVGKSDFVWNRILHILDRMGADIATKNKQQGLIDLTIGELPEELAVERDELSETSWLMNLFSGKQASTPGGEAVANVRIRLNASGHVTRMEVSHQNGQAITSGLAIQFRDSLVNLLR